MKCDRPVRGGVPPYDRCGLDDGHRGYHAGLTFTCDSCGKVKRGQPYRSMTDPVSDDQFGFCFTCVKEGENERRWMRHEYDDPSHDNNRAIAEEESHRSVRAEGYSVPGRNA